MQKKNHSIENFVCCGTHMLLCFWQFPSPGSNPGQQGFTTPLRFLTIICPRWSFIWTLLCPGLDVGHNSKYINMQWACVQTI